MAERKPVSNQHTISLANGQGNGIETVPIPAGKWLVIEFVTVRAFLPQGQVPAAMIHGSTYALTPGATITLGHRIALEGPKSIEYDATHRVLIHVLPGGTLTVWGGRSVPTGSGAIVITWEGYLTDTP